MKRKSSPTSYVDDKRDVMMVWEDLEEKQGYVQHIPGDGGYTKKEWAARTRTSTGIAGQALFKAWKAGKLERYWVMEDGRKSAVYYPAGLKVNR